MRIEVKVIPRAKKEKIENTREGLKVYLTAAPTDGRANKKLIEILAKHFGVKKYHIQIIKGEKQRSKVIEIKNFVGAIHESPDLKCAPGMAQRLGGESPL
jgi:uncharacterized protein (TIGR00251 family)